MTVRVRQSLVLAAVFLSLLSFEPVAAYQCTGKTVSSFLQLDGANDITITGCVFEASVNVQNPSRVTIENSLFKASLTLTGSAPAATVAATNTTFMALLTWTSPACVEQQQCLLRLENVTCSPGIGVSVPGGVAPRTLNVTIQDSAVASFSSSGVAFVGPHSGLFLHNVLMQAPPGGRAFAFVNPVGGTETCVFCDGATFSVVGCNVSAALSPFLFQYIDTSGRYTTFWIHNSTMVIAETTIGGDSVSAVELRGKAVVRIGSGVDLGSTHFNGDTSVNLWFESTATRAKEFATTDVKLGVIAAVKHVTLTTASSLLLSLLTLTDRQTMQLAFATPNQVATVTRSVFDLRSGLVVSGQQLASLAFGNCRFDNDSFVVVQDTALQNGVTLTASLFASGSRAELLRVTCIGIRVASSSFTGGALLSLVRVNVEYHGALAVILAETRIAEWNTTFLIRDCTFKSQQIALYFQVTTSDPSQCSVCDGARLVIEASRIEADTAAVSTHTINSHNHICLAYIRNASLWISDSQLKTTSGESRFDVLQTTEIHVGANVSLGRIGAYGDGTTRLTLESAETTIDKLINTGTAIHVGSNVRHHTLRFLEDVSITDVTVKRMQTLVVKIPLVTFQVARLYLLDNSQLLLHDLRLTGVFISSAVVANRSRIAIQNTSVSGEVKLTIGTFTHQSSVDIVGTVIGSTTTLQSISFSDSSSMTICGSQLNVTAPSGLWLIDTGFVGTSSSLSIIESVVAAQQAGVLAHSSTHGAPVLLISHGAAVRLVRSIVVGSARALSMFTRDSSNRALLAYASEGDILAVNSSFRSVADKSLIWLQNGARFVLEGSGTDVGPLEVQGDSSTAVVFDTAAAFIANLETSDTNIAPSPRVTELALTLRETTVLRRLRLSSHQRLRLIVTDPVVGVTIDRATIAGGGGLVVEGQRLSTLAVTQSTFSDHSFIVFVNSTATGPVVVNNCIFTSSSTVYVADSQLETLGFSTTTIDPGTKIVIHRSKIVSPGNRALHFSGSPIKGIESSLQIINSTISARTALLFQEVLCDKEECGICDGASLVIAGSTLSGSIDALTTYARDGSSRDCYSRIRDSSVFFDNSTFEGPVTVDMTPISWAFFRDANFATGHATLRPRSITRAVTSSELSAATAWSMATCVGQSTVTFTTTAQSQDAVLRSIFQATDAAIVNASAASGNATVWYTAEQCACCAIRGDNSVHTGTTSPTTTVSNAVSPTRTAHLRRSTVTGTAATATRSLDQPQPPLTSHISSLAPVVPPPSTSAPVPPSNSPEPPSSSPPQSPAPTLPPVRVPPPPPPPSVKGTVELSVLLPEDAAAATVATSVSTTAVSGLLTTPTAAGQVVRIGASLQVLQCALVDDDDSPSPLEMPFQVALGGGENRRFAGSLVITVFVFLVLPAAAHRVLWHVTAQKERDQLRKLLEVVSALHAVTVQYFAPVCCGVATRLLVRGDGTTDPIVAVLAIAAMVATVMNSLVHFVAKVGAFGARTSTASPPPIPQPTAATLSSDSFSSVSSSGTPLRAPRSGDETLTRSSSRSNGARFVDTVAGSSFVVALSPFFDGTVKLHDRRALLFFFEELAVSVTVSLLANLRVGSCFAIAIIMAAVMLLHLAYLLVVNPYRTKLDTSIAVIGAVLQAALAVVVAATIHLGSSSATETAIAWLLLALLLLFFAAAIVQFAWYMVRRTRRQQRAICDELAEASAMLLDIPMVEQQSGTSSGSSSAGSSAPAPTQEAVVNPLAVS